METSKCWVIANFEIVAFVLTLIVSAILLALFGLFGLVNSKDVGEVLGVAAVAALLSFPTKKGAWQYGRYVLLLLVGIGMIVNRDGDIPVWGTILFWTVFAIASIISGVIAAYAYDNIDEVVSRRMLYRNSNVSLFEFTWRYTLDRFCSIAFSILACISLLVATFAVAFGWHPS
jgi:hypothetical protein